MMRCGLGRWRRDAETWIRDYDNLQRLALFLLYAQIVADFLGSLSPLFNGVLLLNLGVSLFALVAIESSSQRLARTYAVLLFFSILIDVSWFILFSHHIWHIPSEIYGTFARHLVKLTLAMQIIGFSVRLSSSLVWIQMYRLGVSYMDTTGSRDTDADLRNSFINPATPSPIVRRSAGGHEVVGSSVYNTQSYSSLFEDGRDEIYPCRVNQNIDISVVDSVSAAETSGLLSPSMGSPFHVKDAENALKKLQSV